MTNMHRGDILTDGPPWIFSMWSLDSRADPGGALGGALQKPTRSRAKRQIVLRVDVGDPKVGNSIPHASLAVRASTSQLCGAWSRRRASVYAYRKASAT